MAWRLTKSAKYQTRESHERWVSNATVPRRRGDIFSSSSESSVSVAIFRVAWKKVRQRTRRSVCSPRSRMKALRASMLLWNAVVSGSIEVAIAHI